MQEDDKEFFALVLGVLAAILLVISWWFTTGGISTPAPIVVVDEAAGQNDDQAHEEADEDPGHDEDSAGEHDAGRDGEGDSHDGDGEDEDDAEPSSGDETRADEDAAPTTDESTEPVDSAASVFDAVAEDRDLGVITGLLRDAGLDRQLAGGGPFTLFAPSDDAINTAAGSDTTVAVLESARDEVLTYHVVPGTYLVDDLIDIARGARDTQLTTLQGEAINLSLDGEDLVINGTTLLAPGSIPSDNGVVHKLHNVLVPPVAALNALVGQDPILFATGSATIEESSFPTLDRFIEVLSTSESSVTIEGHTDSSGDAVLNQNLSQNRAQAVLNYLVANGVQESRLSAVGFGPSQPVADNNTEEGRALNRRIEFTLD